MTAPGIPRFLANTVTDQQFSPGDSLGQQVASFRYEVINGRTGIRQGDVYPLRSTIPVLVHNTQNTIMRTLTGLNFGATDTASMDAITDRIKLYMVLDTPAGQTEYPLGRYMYDSTVKQVLSGGDLAQNSLFDEMFIVDQQLTASFAVDGTNAGDAVTILLAPLVDAGLITVRIEGMPLPVRGAWPAGTSRAKVLSDICTQAGCFQPWFDNDGIMRIIPSFNPATKLADFDFDESHVVFRNTISYTNDFLEAPNLYVVTNTTGNTTDGSSSSSFGSYQVPDNAPWSIANRGFTVAKYVDLQSSTDNNLDAVAQSYANQNIVFERTQMSTASDPRHDSYDVIRWQGSQWLEISYSFQLQAGAPTIRTLRKGYA